MKYITCLLATAGIITLPLTAFTQFGTTSAGSSVGGAAHEIGYTIGEAVVTNYISGENYMSSGIIQPIIGEGPVLALDAVSFSVQAEGEEVDVDWTILQDYDQDYFLVERRRDESLDFSSVNQVFAKPQTGLVEYQFTDSNIFKSGVYYYRLKIYDKNGAFSYSEIRSVLIDLDKEFVVNVYPNPTSSLIMVQSKGIDVLDFELFAIGGKKLDSGNVESNTIDLSNLNAGSYVLKITSGKESIYKIVQKTNGN